MIKIFGDPMWNAKHFTSKSTIVSIAYYCSFFVTLETLIGQCYAVCKDYQLSPNGCKNPFNSICDPITHQCTCKDVLSIDFDGYCLQPNGAINEPCWVSDQCLAPKSKCFSKDGKADWMLEISNISWSEYVAKNGSESLIPGICLCNFGHVYDSNEDKCIPRLIDTPCINNSQCSKRSSYTRCISSKCNCAVRHLYNPRNDRCVYVGEGIWQRQNCYDSSCRTRNTEQYIYNHSLANVFGFSLSMSLLMLVWVVLRNCHRTRMTERPVRLEELRYSDLRLSYDPFEVAHHNNLTSEENTHRQNRAREHLPPYEDTGPPTYEEAVIKMGENLPGTNNNNSNNNNNNNNSNNHSK